MRSKSALCGFLLLSACSSPRSDGGTADAAVAPAPMMRGERIVRALRGYAGIGEHLGAGLVLARREAGFVLSTVTGPNWASTGALEATLPLDAHRPLRLSAGSDVWVELTMEASTVAPEIVDGAAVFADVARDTDVVHVAEPGRVEEVRFLRSAAAPTRARYFVHTGAGVSAVRVVDRRIEIVDRAAMVRIASAPTFAIDALGVRRDVDVRVETEGDRTTIVTDLSTEGLTFPVAIDPLWAAAGTMSNPRVSHTATLLSSGKVLVAGGTIGSSSYVSTSDVYDPATNAFTAGPNMTTVRAGHAAVALTSGKVLVTGGVTSSTGYLSTTEIYDPAGAGTFAAAKAMSFPRKGHTATVLSSGKVLVVGGQTTGSAQVSTAEIYDPATDTWSPTTNPMANARSDHWAFLLSSGKVAIIGGQNPGGGVKAAEMFDPATGNFSSAGTMSAERFGFEASLLATGSILVSGGYSGSTIYSSAELFTPPSTWASAGFMGKQRYRHSSTLLASGKVLLAGGCPIFASCTSTSEVYDPSTGGYAASADMLGERTNHVALRLNDNKVLVVGGTSTTGYLSTAEIFSWLANSAACTSGAQCISGNCVDGYCCDTACGSACSACDLPGKVGTCSPVTGAPHGSRTCAPYAACSAGSCSASCSSDADCSTGNYCNGTKCVPKKANGTSCGTAHECGSNFCVDTVCCNTACTEQCKACDVTGSNGTCTFVSGAPHGSRTACSGTGVGTTCGIACNGSATCTYPPSTKACGTSGCSGGTETHPGTCDGAGTCNDTPTGCGAYACGTTACKTMCATNADCATGYYCKASACVKIEGLGTACTDASTCTSGFCTDGVCCATGSCDTGKACNANPDNLGICFTKNGNACTKDDDCGSKHCVDGVCCDSACTDQCAACDNPGSIGKCSAVVGAPHGKRAGCDALDASDCKKKQCDGTTTNECTAFKNGPSVTCGTPSCDGDKALSAPTCTGDGACGTGTPTSCVPYTCGSGACKTACTGNGDCASGFTCDTTSSKCVQGATCSADKTQSIDKTGNATDCAPYICGTSGTCLQQCSTTSDCASGLVCDPSNNKCSAAAGTDDSGGCSTGNARAGSFASALGLALVAMGMRRRR